MRRVKNPKIKLEILVFYPKKRFQLWNDSMITQRKNNKKELRWIYVVEQRSWISALWIFEANIYPIKHVI